jgi:pimeloyl-ACP methyl ester carboxylesterase
MPTDDFFAGAGLGDMTLTRRPEMSQATSRDGTTIAFDRTGQGPPVILVVGAFNTRSTGAPLAASLASRFTVFTYDRRGRGDSGDAAPYAVAREIEDLAALLRAAGGEASVFGFSSGAVLALAAAAAGLAIPKLALYDSPSTAAAALSPAHPLARCPGDHPAELAALIAAGRRGDAVEYFQAKVVGIPEQVVAQLRQAPFRPALEAMAHTLVYDATIVGDGRLAPELVAKVRQPTLAIAGGAGASFMREAAEDLARALPDGRALTLEGVTHDLVPAVLGPVLERFFGGEAL